MSASCIVQYGPDNTRVKSMTVKPVRGGYNRFMALDIIVYTGSH